MTGPAQSQVFKGTFPQSIRAVQGQLGAYKERRGAARRRWIPLAHGGTENVALDFQGFRLLCIASEKSQVDSASRIHPISKTMFFSGPRAVSLAQNWFFENKKF